MASPVDERALAALLQKVASGELSTPEALDELRDLPYQRLQDVKVDHHRELRTGQAEAVYGPGKTPRQTRDAAGALSRRATGAVFVTRASREQFQAVLDVAPGASYSERCGLVVVRPAQVEAPLGAIAVISAGASDEAVAEEASLTAEALGISVRRISDVGVAGIHRLLDARSHIESADCAVVVAGMEGALPSVVAGITSKPMVAVPTSVGYGAAFDGIAALLAMLSACAPGIAVVNIDNGFGAALVAHRILRVRRTGQQHIAGTTASAAF